MSLTHINRLALAQQIAKAKAGGQMVLPPPSIPSSMEEAKQRGVSIKKHNDHFLQLDYEVLSSVLGVEINPEISPLIIYRIVESRIRQMRTDGSDASIPNVVWEMIDGLNICTTSPLKPSETFEKAVVKRKDANTMIIKHGNDKQCIESMAKRGVQVLLQQGEWSVRGDEIEIRNEFVKDFSEAQLGTLWSNCQVSFPECP